jgi:hypothetical protein
MLPPGGTPPNWGQPGPTPPAQSWDEPLVPRSPNGGAQQRQAPMAETPSQQIVNRDLKSLRFQDKRGRMIGVIKPTAAFRMRMLRMLGGELSQNPMYAGMAMMASCVRELDGELLPEPTAPLQVEALVARLDDDGMDAIGEAMRKHFGIGDQETQDQAIATAKNS